MLQTLDAVELSRAGAGAVKTAGKLFVEDFIDEARFAGAGYAGHAGKRAEREFDVNVAQIVFCRAENFQAFPIALPPLFGQRNLFRAGQILPRDGARERR